MHVAKEKRIYYFKVLYIFYNRLTNQTVGQNAGLRKKQLNNLICECALGSEAIEKKCFKIAVGELYLSKRYT